MSAISNSGLDRLNFIAEARREYNDRCVRGLRDFDLILADAYSLDDNCIETGKVEDIDSAQSCMRKSSDGAVRRHTSDINARVHHQITHPDAIT